MKKAAILSPWTGDGLTQATGRRPAVTAAYALQSWQDITGTPGPYIPPDPNLVVIEAVLTDATLAVLDADPAYLILWEENL